MQQLQETGVGGTPRTRYAQAPDGTHLAYQVFGEGKVPLVVAQGQASHLEQQWDFPVQTQFLRRLGQLARVLVFDQRGCGVSDRNLGRDDDWVGQSVGDLVAVMDAAGVERAALYGELHSGPTCIRASVEHPDRIADLLLIGSYARWMRAPDYPAGMPEETTARMVDVVGDNWGTGRTIEFFTPALAGDERQRELFGQFERIATSPGEIRDLTNRWVQQDVRDLLPQVALPTLVLHQRDDPMVAVAHGRYLGEHIPGAHYVELQGTDHLLVGESVDEPLALMSEFLTGTREWVRVDRVLATVLFFDIVGSTEHLARIGDIAWRGLLDDFRRMVRREIERYHGREIDTRGDDFLVVFTSPSGAIAAARAIRDRVLDLGIQLRSGLHLGEIEQQGGDVAGVSVHIGARVQALAEPGQILVSGTVADAVVGSHFRFRDLGERDLKGVPGSWRVHALED
ncbi:MAG TPA: adenylate/guanylate cyclase domain-containing protein [Acidimicrobiia bacterium]|jgi:class 3 adenylate cyclase